MVALFIIIIFVLLSPLIVMAIDAVIDIVKKLLG